MTELLIAIQLAALGVVAWGGLVMVAGVRPRLLAAQADDAAGAYAREIEAVHIAVWRRYNIASLVASVVATGAAALALPLRGSLLGWLILIGSALLAAAFAVKVFEDRRLSDRLMRVGEGTRGTGGALDRDHRLVELLSAILLIGAIGLFLLRAIGGW